MRLEQKLILACGSRIVIMKAEMSLTEQATDVVLADHTTLRVGGPARRLVTVETDQVGESEADKLAKRFLTVAHAAIHPSHRPIGAY